MFPISDRDHPSRFAIVTFLLIVANVFVFSHMLISQNADSIVFSYALVPDSVTLTNIFSLLPFVTSMFLHGGFLHIFSNMWFLHIFGDNVEERLGFFKYMILYFASGIVGAFAQYILNPSSTIPILGASAAISGVLGAYFSYFPHHKIKSVVFVFFVITFADIPAGFYLFFWFVIQFFQGIASIPLATQDVGGVAFAAHAGGFAAGFILSKLLDKPQKKVILRGTGGIIS